MTNSCDATLSTCMGKFAVTPEDPSRSARAALQAQVTRVFRCWRAVVAAQARHEREVWSAAQDDAVNHILTGSGPAAHSKLEDLPGPVLRRMLRRRGYDLPAESPEAAEIGKGTFGQVMRIRRCCDGRVFALKRQVLGATSYKVENALREVSILNASKGAQGLVQIEEAFVEHARCGGDGLGCARAGAEVWAVLEHFPSDLHGMRHEFRSERAAKHAVFEILRGLQALHSGDIVHRDLKPANVLVNLARGPAWAARIAICDFGIARSIVSIAEAGKMQTPKLSRSLSTDVVTASWRSPELWGWAGVERMNRRDVKSIDMFSLGLIWAELLGGKPVIVSEDGRDPPKLRLLEILRRVECPEDKVLLELGFSDEVKQFVRDQRAMDFNALRPQLFGSQWPTNVEWRDQYINYLMHEQTAQGIQAWVLQHALSLAQNCPALGLIARSAAFDYRQRPTAEHLASDEYFRDCIGGNPRAVPCRRIFDVNGALEAEFDKQRRARKSQGVALAKGSFQKVSGMVRAELAHRRSAAV